MTAICPRCGGEVEDLDGFGVLAHEECGYCSHPDCYGGVCRICGDKDADGVWPSPPIREAVVAVVIFHDEWRVIDRWWTDAPISRCYRDVTRGGVRRTEMREGDGAWQDTGVRP